MLLAGSLDNMSSYKRFAEKAFEIITWPIGAVILIVVVLKMRLPVSKRSASRTIKIKNPLR